VIDARRFERFGSPHEKAGCLAGNMCGFYRGPPFGIAGERADASGAVTGLTSNCSGRLNCTGNRSQRISRSGSRSQRARRGTVAAALSKRRGSRVEFSSIGHRSAGQIHSRRGAFSRGAAAGFQWQSVHHGQRNHHGR
jgi:hypothetical protein